VRPVASLAGSAGALGATDLAAAAAQLESALADKHPIDTGRCDRFFGAANATAAVLTKLQLPPAKAEPMEGLETDRGERSRHMGELEGLLEAGNTRALDHLPWLQAWVDCEAPEDGREMLRQIETLDFPAALKTLRGLNPDRLAAAD
jgi:HPt (histidine-containing phosphotransfer) domain-containing protein